MSIRVCHFSSVHPRYDTRIMKMCRSLALAGFEVHFVVADGKPDETIENVHITSVTAKSTNRFSRMTAVVSAVYRKALSLNCDLYHFHDPELLFSGLKLKRKNYRVIYDSHEDAPRDILSKSYIWKPLRLFLSFFVEQSEKYVCPKLTMVISATPFIRDRFVKINRNTEVINNYPEVEELNSNVEWKDKKDHVCFIGGINVERGIYEIVDAMIGTRATLELAGEFESEAIFKKASSSEGWQKVQFHGHVNRRKAREILMSCKAGLVTYHAHLNHVNAQPNKIYEYMSASVPVIASDFPLWKSMIILDRFGLCVNPMDPGDIAEAVSYLLDNPEIASEMGRNGRRAVEEKYNWDIEAKKLKEIYLNLTK
jgi:glycosyltransferase involved in cell wall biosynthesis